MSRFPEYSFTNPVALQLLKSQLQARGHDQLTSKAFFAFLDTLQNADSRIEIIVKNGDTLRGTNITVRLSGRKKVIMWIDILKTVGCKIDINGKSSSLFPKAKPCNFHNNCGLDAVKIALSPDTWQTALTYTLLAHDITPNRKLPTLPKINSLTKGAIQAPTKTSSPKEKTIQPLPPCDLPKPNEYEPNPKDQDYSAEEGEACYRLHRYKERNHKLVIEKKIAARRRDPLLHCEICGFSFEEKYGKWGKPFTEVHHRTPLASLDREPGAKTSLKDLAIVCSNCHSMLHRQGHRTLTVDELKRIIEQTKTVTAPTPA